MMNGLCSNSYSYLQKEANSVILFYLGRKCFVTIDMKIKTAKRPPPTDIKKTVLSPLSAAFFKMEIV
jgi:hypothetical protein